MTSQPAHFETRVDIDGDVARVVALGELDAAAAPVLLDALGRARPDGRTIHLDLEGVTFIDSSGLRVIADEMQTSAERDATFAVIAASKPVRRLFALTGLGAALA